jgi:hypothetical protein
MVWRRAQRALAAIRQELGLESDERQDDADADEIDE